MGLSSTEINALKAAVKSLEASPDLLHSKDLEFFSKYITSLGAKLPEKKHGGHEHGHESSHAHESGHQHSGDCCGHDHHDEHGHKEEDHGHGHSAHK